MKITDKITITCEDNMELMKRYPDNYFHLAIVDPPYGIGLVKTKAGNWGIRKQNKGSIDDHTKWDFEKPTKEYFNELFRVSKDQIIFGANHFIENMPKKNSSCWIVWDKQNGLNYFADSELAWTSFSTAVRNFRTPTQRKNRIHPTQKPIKLYRWLIEKYGLKKCNHKKKTHNLKCQECNETINILDTHLGSGNIVLALDGLKINFVGCELDKYYYDLAVENIKKHYSL